MAPSACIAQTISSKLGDAIVWAIAGNETLHTLQTFETPQKGGFGGRQAFSKGSDAFYSAVQAAVSNSKSYVTEYDRGRRTKATIPRAGVIAFPVVVVDGIIFVAYFDINSGEIKIETTDHVRCHWKGSPAWEFLATVDFVSMQYLDVFARKRAEETKKLIPIMINCYDEIRNFAASGSPEALTVTPGPRGIVGAPSLLRELFAAQKDVASRRVGDKSGTTEIDESS
jgi:hypothetical protein